MRKDWIGETCKCCTREQRLAWSVSDELWDSVVIDHYRMRALCLECFLLMADDRKVKVELEDISFTGVVFR